MFVPDRSQKIRVIRDLVYEYANFMAAAHFDLEGLAPWRTNCNDAFLLGCRKLGDFFLNGLPRYREDVLALDYLPPNSSRPWGLPIWTAKWRDDMDKYLAHITYRRTEDRDAKGLPHWNHEVWVRPLRIEFNHAWWDFRAAVIDSDYNAEFEKQLRERECRPEFKTLNLRRV
jgi:hypothetical protein